MSEPSKKGCKDCNKSTLALLLLRPSPIALAEPLVPVGTQGKVTSDDGLVKGLIPARVPTESRTVLRLLRTGYVYVYLPAPPPGIKNWLVYRVTDNADLIPETSAEFKKTPMPAVCSSSGHNAIGMRLLGIPRAAEISSVWIAYSANLWNDTLKTQNAANPQAMQLLPLGAASVHSFAPTAANLQSKVLECAVPKLQVNGDTVHDFPFNSLDTNASNLAAQLQRAAACHPKTTGKELAVVLADPVGYATELNTLRLRRHALATAEVAKPENAHPLNSNNALTALHKVMVDANEMASFDKVSPRCFKSRFDKQTFPADSKWQPLTKEDNFTPVNPNSIELYGPMGRVVFPDYEERAAAWAKEQSEVNWRKMSRYFDDKARTAWLQKFDARMKTEHYDPLEKMEEDWLGASQDPKTLAYFKLHFDPKDPNNPLKLPSSGVVYAEESHRIHQPAPITQGAVRDRYLTLLDKPITDPSAVVLRALVGNQQEVITVVHTQLTGDSGADGMRDKTYDFLKGLLGLVTGGKELTKYAWMGEALAMFSVGQLMAISGALTSAAARSTTFSQIIQVQRLWGLAQAIDLVAAKVTAGAAPKLPVLVTMQVNIDEALAVLRARKGQNVGAKRTRIQRQTGPITLTLLTDTEAVKAAQGDAHQLLNDPKSGSVNMGGKTAAAGGAVVLSQLQFLKLYQQSTGHGQLVAAMNQFFQKSKTGVGVRAVFMDLDGRLAIGSIVAQGIGLVNSWNAWNKSGATETELRDARYGLMDSTAGALGGVLEMLIVAVKASTIARAGDLAAAQSLNLGAFRFAANIAGAVGGVVNVFAARDKAKDADAQGDNLVADLYRNSATAFLGTAATSVGLAAGAVADTLFARGVGGALVRTIALRLGERGVLVAVGGTALTVSGIGWVLLGAGMAFQIGAIVLTPVPIQRWMSRSYFGKDPSWIGQDGQRGDMFAKGDWKGEYEALQKAIADGSQQPDVPVAPEAKTPTGATAL